MCGGGERECVEEVRESERESVWVRERERESERDVQYLHILEKGDYR